MSNNEERNSWMIHGHGGKLVWGMTSPQHFGVSAPSGYTMHRWYHVAVTSQMAAAHYT